MRLNEIIKNSDLFDVLGHPAIGKLDKLFDLAVFASANFAVPADLLNPEMQAELEEEVANLAVDLEGSTIGPEWQQKLTLMRHWLSK